MKAVRIGCSAGATSTGAASSTQELAHRRWLEHYATLFDTVEVNATFYRLPRRDAVAAWVETVPEEFVFAVKASRYLTHVRRLRPLGRGVERFYASIEPLVASEKLGPILWQLPETFHRDEDRLAQARTPAPGPARLRAPPPEAGSSPTSTPAREHRRRARDRRSSRAALPGARAHRRLDVRPLPPRQPWAPRQLLRARARGVGRADPLVALPRRGHAYFNNDWEGFAVANARELRRLL